MRARASRSRFVDATREIRVVRRDERATDALRRRATRADEAINDDNSVVALNLQKMDELQLQQKLLKSRSSHLSDATGFVGNKYPISATFANKLRSAWTQRS